VAVEEVVEGYMAGAKVLLYSVVMEAGRLWRRTGRILGARDRMTRASPWWTG